MKKLFLMLSITVFLCSAQMVSAQMPTVDKVAQAEMSKLAFLAGTWQGSGWMMGRNGEKHPFKQIERVQFKLDSTALLIEGRGQAGGRVIHEALAVITYDRDNSNYSFDSYMFTGQNGEFDGELDGAKFIWHLDENKRFTIEINEAGQWYEIGEMNRDGQWMQFFEMTLDPKDASGKE